MCHRGKKDFHPQIMNPQMDEGMIESMEQSPFYKRNQFYNWLQLQQVFSESQIIEIFDSIFCAFSTWLQGKSLASTIYTCLYVHNPFLIADKCLYSIVLCFAKCVDLSISLISFNGVFKEEDIALNKHEFLLYTSDFSVLSLLKLLNEVESAVKNEGLLQRIKFLRNFFGILSQFQTSSLRIDLLIKASMANICLLNSWSRSSEPTEGLCPEIARCFSQGIITATVKLNSFASSCIVFQRAFQLIIDLVKVSSINDYLV